MRRYIFMVIPAVLLCLFVTGCYTKLYRLGINGPPEDTYYEPPDHRYIIIRPVCPGNPPWYYHRPGRPGGGTVTPGEPPSKRKEGRRDEGRRNPSPSVEVPSRPPPANQVTNPPKSAPTRPPSKAKKENKQRHSERRKR